MKFRSFYRIFFFMHGIKSHFFLRTSAIGLVLLVSLSTQSVKAQSAIEDIGQLRHQIVQFLTDEYHKSKVDKVEIKTGTLDPRLRLAKCDQPLAFMLQDPNGSGGNVNVQVACRGSSRWTILAPAQATVFRPMAVAGRNLQRGDLITEADVTVLSMDVSQFRQGFVIESGDIIGKEAKYSINKGEAFRTSALNAPLVIKRGEEVSVESSNTLIRVATTATAVSDGRVGEQIRVKNNQSARIVNARVIGPGKVQTIL